MPKGVVNVITGYFMVKVKGMQSQIPTSDSGFVVLDITGMQQTLLQTALAVLVVDGGQKLPV